MTHPTATQVLAIRKDANLTQTQAAARVYAGSLRTWQDWEYGRRKMPRAVWELWRLQELYWSLKEEVACKR